MNAVADIIRSVVFDSLGGDSLFFVLFLDVQEFDVVGKRNAGALIVFGIVLLHHFDLHAHHSLLQHDVPHSVIYVVLLGLSRADHVSLLELHRFGPLLRKLA